MKHTLRSMIDSDVPMAGITAAAKTAGKTASPLAQHVAKHLQDPVGSTQDQYDGLNEAKMNYDMAKQNIARNLAPVKAVIQHVDQLHQMTQDGLMPDPNGMNPDQAQGYDEDGNPMPAQSGMGQPGMSGMPPGNMQQKPGMQQMNNPQNARMVPGASPKIPGGAPGQAAGPAKAVVPQKKGVPSPGQSSSKAGSPGGKAGKQRSMKIEVKGANDITPRRSKLMNAISLSNLGINAGGQGSGCHGDNCGRPGTGGKGSVVEPGEGKWGRHPEAGQFKRTGSPGDKHGFHDNQGKARFAYTSGAHTYTSPTGYQVLVHPQPADPTRKGNWMIAEQQNKTESKKYDLHGNTFLRPKAAREFLKERFGIDHKG